MGSVYARILQQINNKKPEKDIVVYRFILSNSHVQYITNAMYVKHK